MIKCSSKATLRKYGLTEELWYNLLDEQDGKCPICLREFTEELRPCIDHFHAPRFKKMKPESKRFYVRGLTCRYCNQRRLVKGLTVPIVYRMCEYLRKFEEKVR